MRELELEAARQPDELERYHGVALPRCEPGTLYVGAGDSYAAALAGFYASRGRCAALDPYELASEPEIARGRTVCFISVSGKTRSNIRAASKVTGIAKKTRVVTAVGGSPLARKADEVVLLPMEYAPRSPGVLSFALSALAILKMAGAQERCDFGRAFRRAETDCRVFSLGRGTTYILGNGLARAAALYTAAKVYETIGARSHAESLEEFSHMELFSLRAMDSVNVFADVDPDGVGARLGRALSAEGFRSGVARPFGRSKMESFFHCVFTGQLWCLGEARRAGVKRPRFLAGARRLRISDSMIY